MKNKSCFVDENFFGCYHGTEKMQNKTFVCDKNANSILRNEVVMFSTIHYTVESIDGDYANLRNENEPNTELKLVARALLPAEIREGSRLKYEMLQYELVES